MKIPLEQNLQIYWLYTAIWEKYTKSHVEKVVPTLANIVHHRSYRKFVDYKNTAHTIFPNNLTYTDYEPYWMGWN